MAAGLTGAALLLATPLSLSVAHADGGQGGGGGGTGGAGFAGNNGNNGFAAAGGGGGGAGGGDGGIGFGNNPGGAGGDALNKDGENAPPGNSGGGGGGGGFNGNGSGDAFIDNAAPLSGGNGGAGGNATIGGGGGGGAGGYGAIVLGTDPSSNTSTIAGGNGGAGGASTNNQGGGGGDGGVGVWFDAPGAVFINSGTVTGGDGGAGGTGSTSGADGRGGVGVAGSGLTVIMNGGAIVGGLGGDGVTQADAIAFGTGFSALTLNGGTLTGNISIASGGNIDFNQAGSYTLPNAITGAGSISHTGPGTLTLNGINTFGGGATISNGVVVAGTNNALGDVNGLVTLNGGTLRAGNAGLSFGHQFFIDGTASTIDTQAFTMTLTGAAGNSLIGSGTVTKTGTGTLVLGGVGLNDGTVAIQQGTVRAAAANALGQATNYNVGSAGILDVNGFGQDIQSLTGSGNVTNNNATGAILRVGVNNTVDTTPMTFAGSITNGAGAIGLTVDGTRPLILTGTNNYSLGTLVCDCSTLQLGDGGTTGSITGDVALGGILVFNRSDEYIFSGTITDAGGGRITQAGTGTTILTAANSYTGGTAVVAGTLAISSVNGSNEFDGMGSGDVFLDGGTLRTMVTGALVNPVEFFDGSTSRLVAAPGTVQTVAFALAINDNATAIFGSPADNGTILIDAPAFAASTSSVIVAGGTLQDAQGYLAILLLDTSSVTVNAGATIDFNNSPFQGINNLNGAGNVMTGTAGNGFLLLTGDIGRTNLFSGVISGANAVQIGGFDTMIFAGDNTYTGGTIICGCGTLQLGNGGTTGSILGDVLNDGALIFNRSNSYTFDGVISGIGSVIQNGTGTTVLTAINTYSGPTTVNAGTLSVNGSIASSVLTTVNSGGTLGGTGSVFDTVINGGTLAPGNSIGTFTVTGNLTFTGGSTYAVEISPTAADRTNVSGSAALAGTVNVTASPGVYAAGQQFTIIKANGGFNGTTFDSITGTAFATGTPSLSYDSDDVFLTFTQRGVVLLPTFPGNAGAVADGINAAMLGGADLPASFQTLFGYGNAQLGSGLVQLAGQHANAAWLGSMQMMNAFLSMMLNPQGGAPGGNPGALGFARGFGPGEQVPPEAAAAYAAVTPKDKRAPAQNFGQRWGVWGQGYGGYNTTDGQASAGVADVTTRTWGLAAGADYRATANTTLGFALAGGNMKWGLSDSLGGGNTDTFQIGGFGSHSFGNGYVSAALSYAWHDTSTDRTVTTVGFEQMTANFRAWNVGGRIETGYRIATPWLGVTPYAAAQVQQYNAPTYSETTTSGTGAFALTYQSRAATTTRLELGAWFDRTVVLEGGQWLSLRGRAAYANDHASDNTLTAVFQSLPGSAFVVNGAPPPKHLALVSAGAELRLTNNWTVGAKFDGEFANSAQTYTGTGSIRYAW